MKKQNGITLISLIITIIIMLILAGVSLSMVMGDGSMLDQANAAAANTRIAEVQEYVDLAAASNKMAKYSKMGLKSKATVVTEMADQDLITDEQKDDVLNNGADLEINGTVINFDELVTTYQAAADAGVTEEGASSPVAPSYWNITVNDETSVGATSDKDRVEQGKGETVTLTAVSADDFSRWEITGTYTISSGTLNSSTIVIVPASDIVATAKTGAQSPT